MKVLVLGASGATGKLLVEELLKEGREVKVIVRSLEKIPESWKNNDRISIIHASFTELSDEEIAQHIKDCRSIASCLGHNLTFKGMYGKPRRLVTDAIHRFCKAVKESNQEKTTKYVLMNTAGNSNRDLNEKISFPQKIVISLFRLLLPPHVDNEKAADYLRENIGQNDVTIEWVAVRPDSLIDEEKVTEFEIFPSPVRSAVFNPGKTSRINVARFMTDLIINDNTWAAWKGKMPVIYNKSLFQ